MFSGDGMGVYTQQTQFDFDTVKLTSLGFNKQEIDTLSYIISNGGKMTTNWLTQYGLSYEESKRIRYMYDICIGKVIVENQQDLVKHLKKMSSGKPKIGLHDLPVSKINKVPRKAVIAGIEDKAFKIYNSEQYSLMEQMYDVMSVTSTKVYMKTSRKPVLKYKQPKEIQGIIEVGNVGTDGLVDIAVSKKYCKLINRFIIVASLRRPEFHLGLVEIICLEGTKVYVYGYNMGVKENVTYNMGTQRVYDYGIHPSQINSRLKGVASSMYKNICGVYAALIPANQEFTSIPLEVEDTEEIEIED